MDPSKLTTLGPFARALFYMLNNGDVLEQKRSDSIKRGVAKSSGSYGYFSECYMLFKGATMKKKWLHDLCKNIGKKVRMNGSTTILKNLVTALNYSKCAEDKINKNLKPVLFVYLIKNFKHFYGFRLNNQNYSAYPQEQEYLFMEGMSAWILNVEDDVVIKNEHPHVQKFNGKPVTIVYFYIQ